MLNFSCGAHLAALSPTMTLSIWTCVRRVALAVILGASLEGTAAAAAFSPEVTPFPAGGVYIPVVGQEIDPENPLFLYEAFFFPPVLSLEIAPGIIEYQFPISLSASLDPLDTLVIGAGLMYTRALGGGVYETCWSMGCAPDPAAFPFFEVADFSGQLVFRADPDAGRQTVGTMNARALAGGGYAIDSFFDIFVEICVAGCESPELAVWEDVEGAVSYQLIGEPVDEVPEVPEPSTVVLFGAGLAALGARRWRARRQ